MTTARVGMRVLRGPDWPSGDDSDGGEGHLGTVVKLLEGDRVRILWDNGKQVTCRSGADGKFDLRVFDTGPVGVRHPDTTCAACDERNIYGMLWRCKMCRACDLCPLCYVSDKHDIKHDFLRFDEPGSSGQVVKKRSISLKIRAIGIFPGAKVTRGKDWAWGDQDGGAGKVGEVQGYENVAPESSRNIVRVLWPSGNRNSYRLGLHGNVDLTCVEEEPGNHYYRDHLPVLRTCRGPSSSSPSSSSSSSSTTTTSPVSDNATIFAKSSSSSQSSPPGATSGAYKPETGEITAIGVGDKVVVQVDEDKLQDLQAKYGGCTATMLRSIGRQGEVVSLAPNGAVGVKFQKLTYRLNPEAILKVPELKVGDMVRIRSDVEQVKILNKRMTWSSSVEQTLGKVGQVTKIDSDGDVVVLFGHTACMYSPACCIPVAAGTSADSIAKSDSSSSSSRSGSGRSDASSSGDSDDYGDLHHNMMRFIAQMAGLNLREIGGSSGGKSSSGGGGGGDGDIMQRLLRAVAKNDAPTVRDLCQENPGVVNRVHKGMTPLIMASHEGQKDMCSCLLAQGADINKMGEKGTTPLGSALEGKKEQIALYLLEKGANPNVRNAKDRNPVHLAAYHNLPEAIKALIQKGADVNAKDQYGDTPLHDAIDRDNADAVDMLLRAKTIDVQAQNKKGFNTLHQAALKGNAHATERILQRDSGQVDKLLDGQYSALHIAANNDHVDCIKLLVKVGSAEVDKRGHNGLTPLLMACWKGHIQSMEVLLDLGAAVNVKDSDGDTPLHLAIGARVDNPDTMRGQLELRSRIRMACMLISKGAYPDARNKKGSDPLDTCRYSGVESAVKQFMKENPQVVKRCGGGGGGTTLRGGSGGRSRVEISGGGLRTFLEGMTLPCGGAGCSRMSDITLLPCGHKTLCRNCCLRISECPLCDTAIERRIHRREDSEVDLSQACKQM
ncbi:E3 ubiquitin-protein ligase MIB2-like [Babylonia areolata]|uniref:E3 ubiquitin-protein ligase MIB2-like n=1 Tax=Babylonia areolata TaxID=304850 RepID=UPI003FD2C26E